MWLNPGTHSYSTSITVSDLGVDRTSQNFWDAEAPAPLGRMWAWLTLKRFPATYVTVPDVVILGYNNSNHHHHLVSCSWTVEAKYEVSPDITILCHFHSISYTQTTQ